MNIPAWAVTAGLVVIIIVGAAWLYSRSTEQSDRQDTDDDKAER